MTNAPQPALQTHSLCKYFGALKVANNVDFSLSPGGRHGLIGPNGAGKTTFINLVSGAIGANSGRIQLQGRDITGHSEAQRVKRGLVRTFQITSLFRTLSVLENICLAASEQAGTARKMLVAWQSRGEILDAAWRVLKTLGLEPHAQRRVAELPYGQQRLIEIAIALVLEPSVLLLDEPAAGVPSHETKFIIEVIEQLPSDISVLVIDHDMDLIFRIAKKITVLVEGGILCEGTPDEISRDPRVREVYLGKAALRR
jgi:branched-chain amino acid transport system ATP-binding protein